MYTYIHIYICSMYVCMYIYNIYISYIYIHILSAYTYNHSNNQSSSINSNNNDTTCRVRRPKRHVGGPGTSASHDGMHLKIITPSPPTKSFDFRGFDSSKLLILRGGNSHVRIIL